MEGVPFNLRRFQEMEASALEQQLLKLLCASN